MQSVIFDSVPAQFADFIAKNEIVFQVTAITYDGEEITVHIEASSKEEAAQIAAETIYNVDYITF